MRSYLYQYALIVWIGQVYGLEAAAYNYQPRHKVPSNPKPQHRASPGIPKHLLRPTVE